MARYVLKVPLNTNQPTLRRANVISLLTGEVIRSSVFLTLLKLATICAAQNYSCWLYGRRLFAAGRERRDVEMN